MSRRSAFAFPAPPFLFSSTAAASVPQAPDDATDAREPSHDRANRGRTQQAASFLDEGVRPVGHQDHRTTGNCTFDAPQHLEAAQTREAYGNHNHFWPESQKDIQRLMTIAGLAYYFDKLQPFQFLSKAVAHGWGLFGQQHS